MSSALDVNGAVASVRSGRAAQPPVDFTRSIPPQPDIFQDRLARSLMTLAGDNRLGDLARISSTGGVGRDREAGMAWLEPRFGRAIEPGRVVLANGTQSALLLLLHEFVGHGGLIYTETLSYGIIRQLSERTGARLVGAPLDDNGVIPEALEEMCRRESPRAFYCNPGFHNPTTSIMPEERRLKIAAIARRYGFPIIEDDTLGRLYPDSARPIAALAPDVTWYVAGVTKCLAHGMRVAYTVGPSIEATAGVVGPAARLSHWFPAPIQAAIVTRWIEDGTATELSGAIRRESALREKIAAQLLGPFGLVTKPASMHVWLPLPAAIPRHEFVAALQAEGVLVRPSEMFTVDDTPPPNAVRLSLSSPNALEDVARGLNATRGVLERWKA